MSETLAKILAACVVLALGACATNGKVVERSAKAVEAPAPMQAVAEPEPDEDEVPENLSTFLLPAAGTNVVGELRVVVARYEDTLSDLARQYNLGYKEITEANPDVDPWLPGAGTRIVLPTQFILPDAPRTGVVLNVSAMRLFYYPRPKPGESAVVITHPIGIGRESWDTPLGAAKVVEKIVKPKWRVPASIRAEHARDGDPLPSVVPAGPDNPLGEYAMRLSIPGYLIHGTNRPYGIGMRVSHGCIQLYPEDIAQIFGKVSVGTPVRIVDQPYLVGHLDGDLFLKAHEPETRSKQKKLDSGRVLAALLKKAAPKNAVVDFERAKRAAAEARGIPTPLLAGSPELEDVISNARQLKRASFLPSVAGTQPTPRPQTAED